MQKHMDMNIMTTRMFTHTGPRRRGDVFSESTFAKANSND